MAENPSNNLVDTTGDSPAARQPHAVLDLTSRRFKGLKIERLSNLSSRPRSIRMFDQVPDRLLNALGAVNPTLVYRFWIKESGAPNIVGPSS